MSGHRYPPEEYDRVEGQPLEPRRLAQIWASLPEKERLGFILSLEERLADEVLTLTVGIRTTAAGGVGSRIAATAGSESGAAA